MVFLGKDVRLGICFSSLKSSGQLSVFSGQYLAVSFQLSAYICVQKRIVSQSGSKTKNRKGGS